MNMLKNLDKNTKILLVLALVLVAGTIIFLIVARPAEVPVQKQEQFPRVEFVEGRPFTPIEDKIVKTVLELNRSPVAHFMISISGVVRGFYDRTLIVEAEGEQLRVPILEGAVIVTEVWQPVEIPEVIARLTPEQMTLLQVLTPLEMIKQQGFLPRTPLEQVITQIRGKVGDIPAEQMPPALFAPPAPGAPRLEPFSLENIKIGDIVRIQARVGVFGDLEAFEVIVTPIR